ncbi:CehA/McbA family metallohydrolase domain-containing protein [Telluribacter humicola]|uniref:histidinol-phosphatase n=1 Tax=Telluribacter humicola TaxID=1720261 RepID=UPI001A963B9D|nr:histidinol-phosphatase [Telluribacter humicola]
MRFPGIILLLLLATGALAQQTRWYKGNTHTHSYWSDGDDFPEMILDWYKTRGYDFIALSDHNVLADKEYWKQIPTHPFRQRRFREYLEKYGDQWVNYRTDSAGRTSVKLKKLDEFRPLFEEKGKFLIIKAEEITDGYLGKPIHMNAINVQELVKPRGGNSVAEVMQNNLDAVYEQREQTGQPMFPHINHPNFGWAIKAEDMMQLRGERFFEVYNGHPHVHNYGDSVTVGMEELWDQLLVRYLEDGKPPLYGLATDDSHNYLEYKVGLSNPGRGWIMVRATELSPDSLIAAMERGDFYATTGVTLKDIHTDHNTLSVKVAPEARTRYKIQFWGARPLGAGTSATVQARERVLLKEVKGTRASYTLSPKDLYVRARIISTQVQENPFQEGDLETAWTQPLVRKEDK